MSSDDKSMRLVAELRDAAKLQESGQHMASYQLLRAAAQALEAALRPSLAAQGLPPDANSHGGNADGLFALLEENKRLKALAERQMNDAEAARLELAEWKQRSPQAPQLPGRRWLNEAIHFLGLDDQLQYVTPYGSSGEGAVRCATQDRSCR